MAMVATFLPAVRAGLPRVSLALRKDGSGDRVFVADGREMIFHGTNVVVKGPPWLPKRDAFDPLTSLVEKDFEIMREAGINLLRLGAMWAGAEPVRGQYNETYFQELRRIVEEADAHGIYVLLDMHQDLLSERFCGEGVPAWAAWVPENSHVGFPVPLWTHPAALAPDGFPTRQECSKVMNGPILKGWAVADAAVATGMAYRALYVNENNLTEAWGAFWAKVATSMQGLTNVLGFELMNEPFPGNPFKDPLLLLPGVGDRRLLQPAYDTLVRHIRQVDQETLVFFAGITWDNNHPVGFTAAPGGPDEAHRSVFAYHYYQPPQGKDFETYMKVRQQDARRLGTGLMMTESCNPQLASLVIPTLHSIGHSWIHWEWKDWCREDDETLNWPFQAARFGGCKTGYGDGPFNSSGVPAKEAMADLAWPYAPAVAGALVGKSWNATAKIFELRFRPDQTATRPTEIFVNGDLAFPSGFQVHVNPPVLDVQLMPEQHAVFLSLLPGVDAPELVSVVLQETANTEIVV